MNVCLSLFCLLFETLYTHLVTLFAIRYVAYFRPCKVDNCMSVCQLLCLNKILQYRSISDQSHASTDITYFSLWGVFFCIIPQNKYAWQHIRDILQAIGNRYRLVYFRFYAKYLIKILNLHTRVYCASSNSHLRQWVR